MARGNTLDYRGGNNGTIPSAYIAVSNLSTVGVGSYTGSRPESAVKKKPGMSPSNQAKVAKIING
jgi:hypothetical protein